MRPLGGIGESEAPDVLDRTFGIARFFRGWCLEAQWFSSEFKEMCFADVMFLPEPKRKTEMPWKPRKESVRGDRLEKIGSVPPLQSELAAMTDSKKYFKKRPTCFPWIRRRLRQLFPSFPSNSEAAEVTTCRAELKQAEAAAETA